MLPQWQTGVVTRIEQASPNTRRYWVQLPAVQTFSFLPGQFVTLDLPIHEQRNKRWRSYSIASAPDGGNVIELVIVSLDGGIGSRYIYDEVTVGSNLMLRGPQGVFTMPADLTKDIFLICTGTGIAPFRSMLKYIINNNIAHSHIHLIFGTRTEADLLYRQEMEEMEQAMPGFHYHPTLSRQEWSGRMGYVHPVYETLCQAHQPAQFLLCGWRPMIDEAKLRIQALGYSTKDILVEIYG